MDTLEPQFVSRTQIGLFYCFSFVTLEALQAVYFGAVFQNVDSFLVGMWVFGISFVGCTVVTAIFRPRELSVAIRGWKIVVLLNLFSATAWGTYFIAVQLVEPAIVFTIFSGMVPLATVVAGWIGLPEASSPRRLPQRLGYYTILLSILMLAAITVFGFSGFVRGDWPAALVGVALSALSGGFTAFVILYSVRLSGRGVGPLAQFGLRFALYTVLAFTAFTVGLDDKGVPLPADELVWIVIIGLAVIAFPLYLVQRAIPLLPVSVIAAMTALGPVMVFLMQLVEGRVDYSAATLAGLMVYVLGSLLAIYGATTQAATGSAQDGSAPARRSASSDAHTST